MRSIQILLIGSVLAVSGCGKTVESDYSVMKGLFRQTFTEPGELQAISSHAILMPRINYQFGYEFKIVELAESGKMVKAGDTVIRLDASTVEKYILNKEEALESELAAKKVKEVQLQNTLQDLQANLKKEQASFELKRLEMERSKFEPEGIRKIKELEYKIAMINKEKVSRQIQRKLLIDQFDYEIQKIKVLQVESVIADARNALGRFTITSPKEGMFQVEANPEIYPPKPLKVGDNAYPGVPLARIPDIYHMKVKTFINEADYSKAFKGMPVVVRLDALPEIAFHGKVTEISRGCILRDKEMVFNVIVEIEESDLRLKPGMTVSCEYVAVEHQEALFVSNSCLLKEAGKTYVFIRKKGGTRKTEVRTGASNSYHTVIESDLKPGQPLVPCDQAVNPKKS